MSNVFIFGATGALGSLMTKFLIKKNYKVFSDKIIKKKIKKKNIKIFIKKKLKKK